MTVIRRTNFSPILSSRRLSTVSRQVTIGIRREDPARIWERRCPITPDAVELLVRKENVKVLVQDCDRRIFPITEFVKVCNLPSPLASGFVIIFCFIYFIEQIYVLVFTSPLYLGNL